MVLTSLTGKKQIMGLFARFSIVILLTAFFPVIAECQSASAVQPFGNGINAKRFFSSAVDDNNTIWFLTDAGIVSFNGSDWTLHNRNPKATARDIRDISNGIASSGSELWIAGSAGVTVFSVPVDDVSEAVTYYPGNSQILSGNVLAVAAGKKDMLWFGTDKGISAFRSRKWLVNDYSDRYPEGLFEGISISSMAVSKDGDSLYVGTIGGGVMRVFRNDVDAVSGASEYMQWGPILMPSDTVYCIHIARDGTQWIGTARGVTKHKGSNTLEGWTIYDSGSGLANNVVQSISSDANGNLYFGTRNGLSVFDGNIWRSYNTEKGLVSNNILTIAVDKRNVIWIGTDNGITCIKEGNFVNYR